MQARVNAVANPHLARTLLFRRGTLPSRESCGGLSESAEAETTSNPPIITATQAHPGPHETMRLRPGLVSVWVPTKPRKTTPALSAEGIAAESPVAAEEIWFYV